MPSRLRLLVALPLAVLLLAIGGQAAVTDDALPTDESTVAVGVKSIGQPSPLTRPGPTHAPALPLLGGLALLAVCSISASVAGRRAARVPDAGLAWRSLLLGAPPLLP